MRRSMLNILLPLLGPLDITGDMKDLPDGGVLVIINHSSLIDPFIVYLALREKFGRKVAFLAAAGLWKIPFLGLCFRYLKFIPVYRKSDNPAGALAYAVKALREGRVVAMYPEGHIPYKSWEGSEDKMPSPIRTGAARVWYETGVPVLVLAQLGARRVMSGGKRKQAAGLFSAWLRRFFNSKKRGRIQLRVRFGRLITQKASGDAGQDTAFLKDAMDRTFEDAKNLAA